MDLYILIATRKTGILAIQNFLNKHRTLLIRQFSTLYPNLAGPGTVDFFSGNCENHIEIFRSTDAVHTGSRVKKLIEEAKARNIQKVILSVEALSSFPAFAHTLHDSLLLFPDVNVTVLIYLRRQDHWLESAWIEWGIKDKQFRDIDQFLASYGNIFPYNSNPLELSGPWEREFGTENLIIQPFENEQLVDGMIRDFFNKIGIDCSKIPGYDPQRDRYFVNARFTRDIVEIFQLNKDFYRGIDDNRLFNLFSKYMIDTYKRTPVEDYPVFSPRQRLDILGKYLPVYETVAKKYLGRADGRLFFEPLPDPAEPWKPYTGLTLEEFVPVFTQVLYNMENWHQKLILELKKNPVENPKDNQRKE